MKLNRENFVDQKIPIRAEQSFRTSEFGTKLRVVEENIGELQNCWMRTVTVQQLSDMFWIVLMCGWIHSMFWSFQNSFQQADIESQSVGFFRVTYLLAVTFRVSVTRPTIDTKALAHFLEQIRQRRCKAKFRKWISDHFVPTGFLRSKIVIIKIIDQRKMKNEYDENVVTRARIFFLTIKIRLQ